MDRCADGPSLHMPAFLAAAFHGRGDREMRLLEMTLSLANIVTMASLAIPRLRAMRWMGLAAAITALTAVIQPLVEGPRWQMLPAYALTAAFFLIWLLCMVVAGRIHVGLLVTGTGIALGALLL